MLQASEADVRTERERFAAIKEAYYESWTWIYQEKLAFHMRQVTKYQASWKFAPYIPRAIYRILNWLIKLKKN